MTTPILVYLAQLNFHYLFLLIQLYTEAESLIPLRGKSEAGSLHPHPYPKGCLLFPPQPTPGPTLALSLPGAKDFCLTKPDTQHSHWYWTG